MAASCCLPVNRETPRLAFSSHSIKEIYASESLYKRVEVLSGALVPPAAGPPEPPPPLAPAASPAPPLSATAVLAQLLGEALAVLRVISRQSQTDLGAASGVPRDSISDYERGRFAPRADTLRRLVEAMGFTAATFERPVHDTPRLTTLRTAAPANEVC